MSFLFRADLWSILDTSTDYAVGVDTRDGDVAARVHLAHMGCEGTSLLRARVELELVSTIRILG